MSKEKITISEIVDVMSAKNSFSKKQTEEFVKMLLSTIEDVLIDGEVVKIKGFGTFKPQWNEPRKSVDVNTGEEIIVSGYYKVVFVPDNELKELVNKPFSHLQAIEQTQAATQEKASETEQEEKSEKESTGEKTTFESVKITKEPLRVFEEQAEQIKGLLSEIGALSGKTEEPIETEEKQHFVGNDEEDEDDFSIDDTENEEENDDMDVDEENVILENEENSNDVEEEAIDEPKLSRKQRKKLAEEERKQRRREEIQNYFDENDFGIVREIQPEEVPESQQVEAQQEKVEQPEIIQEETVSEQEPEKINTEITQEAEVSSEAETDTDSSQKEDVQPTENQEEKSISEEETKNSEPEKIIAENVPDKIISDENPQVSENETTETPQNDEKTVEEETTNAEETDEQTAEPVVISSKEEKQEAEKEEVKGNPVLLSQQAENKSIQKNKLTQTANSKPEDIDYTFTPVKKRKGLRWLWWLLAVLLIAGAAYLIWFFFPNIKPYLERFKPNTQQVVEDTIPKQITAVEPQTVIPDSTVTQPNDTVYSDSIFNAKREYKDYIASAIITPEKNIKRLAKDYYGNDAFWVYIYEANIETIEDPKNIPSGTVVKIPKLDSRLINVNNPETIKRAKKLTEDYLYFEN